MSKPDLYVPSRQEVRGFLVVFVFEAQKMIRAFWPILIVLVAQKNILPEGVGIPAVIGLMLLLLLVHAILYFRSFYFYVEGNQFVLKKGYLRKVILSVPLERIQSVNTKQNLLQQLFDVHTLEIDTAGSAGKELKISSLSGPYTELLTEFLQRNRSNESDTINSDKSEKEDQLILKLSPKDLLRIGISQNHLRTGLVIVAFGSQIVGQLRDLYNEQTESYSNSAKAFIADSGVLFYVAMAGFFILVSILATLLVTVVKYYDFKLEKHEKSYRITAGLFNKRKVLLPFSKIQQLNWETGPIKKLFGIFKISFKQAVSRQSNQIKVADAPGCLEHHVAAIREELFKDEFPDHYEKIKSHHRYFIILWVFSGVLPAIAPIVFYFHQPLLIIAGVLWMLLAAGYFRLAYRKRYFQFNKQQLVIGKGAISTVWQQVETYKTQNVDFKQSIFQKRRALASLRINNASGSIYIPYIPEDVAHKLMNAVLYHAEQSGRQWM